MLKQVLSRLFIISFVVFILTAGANLYLKFNNYEWYLLSKILHANLIKNLPEHFNTIKVKLPNNKSTALTYQKIFRNQALIKLKGKFNYAFIKSLKLGFIITISTNILIIIWLIHRSANLLEKKYLKGSKLVSNKQLIKIIKKYNTNWIKKYAHDNKDSFNVPIVKIADIPLPIEADTQNILLCGAPGSGKTVLTHQILSQVRSNQQRAIVYDIEGSFIPTYYRPGVDIILNPLDERSPYWNLWQECKSLQEFEDLANHLIPNSHNLDDFWTKAARCMFSITAHQYSQRTNPTLKEFLRSLFASTTQDIETLLKGTLGEALVGKDLEKGTKSILLTLATHCKSLLYLKEKTLSNEETFSIKKWINHGHPTSWLFISTKEEYRPALAPLISMWADIAISAFLTLPEDYKRRFWIYFDELSSLNKQPKLISFLERARKRGGCLVASIHDFSQLSQIYGSHASETIRALMGTNIYFYTNNYQSALIAAENLGRSEFIEANEGYTMGAHEMRDGVNIGQQAKKDLIIMPAEIMNLRKLEAFMKIAGGWPITKLAFNYTKQKKSQAEFIMRDNVEISANLS